MAENGIAAFVHPQNIVPTLKIQGPNVGELTLDVSDSSTLMGTP
jgi:hypothetical protein